MENLLFASHFQEASPLVNSVLLVISSPNVFNKSSYAVDDEPTCLSCELRVAFLELALPPTNKSCALKRIVPSFHPFAQDEATATGNALNAGIRERVGSSQTLVFLCIRKSGKGNESD